MLQISSFVLFAVVGIMQLMLMDRIRVILSARHPHIFRELRARAWPNRFSPMSSALANFIGKRGDKGLGDANLSRLTTFSRWLYIPLIIAFFLQIFAVFANITR